MGYILFNLLMSLICVVCFMVVIENPYAPVWAKAVTAFLAILSLFLTALVAAEQLNLS